MRRRNLRPPRCRSPEDNTQTTFLPQLAAAESERRALIRGALAALGLRRDLANGLESLLMYLDAAAGEHGCRAYIRTLVEQVNAGKRTIDRRLKLLRDHRLIRSQRSRPGGPCFNRLDWERIRDLAFRGEEHDEPATGPDASASQAPPAASALESTAAASASDGGRRFGEAAVAIIAAPHAAEKSGATSRLSGATSRLNGAFILTNLTNLEPPPPTPPEPSVVRPGADRDRADCDGWHQAERAVAAAGVASWERAIATARGHGLTPGDVLAIVADWRRQLATARWENAAGMLVYLLRVARPDTIPRPATPAPVRETTRARRAERPPDEHCAAFEALSPEQQDELARQALDPVLLRIYRADRESPLARLMMIGFLRERGTP